MLYREIIAVCSEIHTKHVNTLCGQNVGLLNAKLSCTYSNNEKVIIFYPMIPDFRKSTAFLKVPPDFARLSFW